MKNFISSLDAYNNLQKNVLMGSKIPHRVSIPVLRYEDGVLVLASFIFFFNKKNLDNKNIERPKKWVTLNLIDGEIMTRFDCSEKDFSSQRFGKLYDIAFNKGDVFDKNYYLNLFEILDDIRKEFIESNVFNNEKYSVYLEMLLDTIPECYQIFYKELSS